MSIKSPTPRWRVVLSLLALVLLLSAHAIASSGPVPEGSELAAGMVLLALLAPAAVARNIGWPIARR
jgi:hypothetical protein